MNQFKLIVLCLGLVGLSACPPPVTNRPCSSLTCPGCCDANGQCQSGLTVTACGASGNDCSVCGTNQSCNSGTCSMVSGAGGGSAGGVAGGGTAGDGGTAGGAAGGTVLSCASGLTLCGTSCINTRTDYANCGMCGRSCGAGQYCDNNQCQNVPAMCTPGPGACPSNFYCDAVQQKCIFGCQASSDCGGGQICDTANARCGCPMGTNLCGGSCLPVNTPTACGTQCLNCSTGPNSIPACNAGVCEFTCAAGYHKCGNQCVSNFDAMSCGMRCNACPVPPNGTATCDGTDCGSTCAQGFHQCGPDCVSNFDVASCGNSCSPCMAPANAIAQCMSVGGGAPACTFTCNPGFVKCGNACVTESVTSCGATCQTCTPPVGATNPQCTNGQCQYTCATGFHQCGSQCVTNMATATCGTNCTPCPAPLNGTATCDGTSCGIQCNVGYHDCNGQCVSNFSINTCGTRCQICPDGPAGSGTTVTCDGIACGLRCASTTTPNFCGNMCVADSVTTCGTSCQSCTAPSGATAFCQNGICDFTCPTGSHRCGTQCVSDSSVTTCGASCSACPAGPPNTVPTCTRPSATSQYACGWDCGAGTNRCPAGGTQCVPADYTLACGPTCAVCSSTAPLERGVCGSNGICSTGCITSCGGACVNTQTSATHCGACNTACGSGDRCSQAECRTYCSSGIALGSMATSTSVGTSVFPFTVVDINADGRADLVSAESYYLYVRLGLANASGTGPNGAFSTTSSSHYFGSTAYSPTQLTVGDLTGDGLPEVVVTTTTSVVVVFRNTGTVGGTPAFQPSTISTTYVATSATIGEFNGSVPADLLLTLNTTLSSSAATLYPGTAIAGTPVGAATPAGLGIGSVSGGRAATINADSNADFVVTAGSNAIYVYPGTGNGTAPFVPANAVLAQLPSGESFITGTVGSAMPFEVGDVTGDGIPDAVVPVVSGGGTVFGVRVFPINASFVFGTSSLLSLPAATKGIAIADINGDGRRDVVAASTDVRIFLSQAGGTFSAPQILSVSVLATFLNSLAAADITGDNRPEIFTPSGSTLITAVNNGSGGFAGLQGSAVPNAIRITVGDLNGDGYSDVAATSPAQGVYAGPDTRLADVTVNSITGRVSGRLEVLVNGTWGSICLPQFTSPNSNAMTVACRSVGLGTYYNYGTSLVTGLPAVMRSPSCTSTLSTSLLSCSYLPVDTSCTGTTNLTVECNPLVGAPLVTETQILFGSSTGTFTSGPRIPTRGDRAAIGNLNGDNALDLVVAAPASVDAGVPFVLEVRNGATNSMLGAPTTLAARALPTFLTTAEVSGDTQEDIIMGSALGVDVYRNIGASGFATPVTVSTTGVSSIAVADFNLDGRRDLVTAGTSFNLLLPLMNVALPGNVGFLQGTSLSPGTWTNFSVLTGDVNYDGKPDVVFGRYVYAGNGAGGFTTLSTSLATQPPRQALVDLDADGALDLVAAGAASSVLSVAAGTAPDAGYSGPDARLVDYTFNASTGRASGRLEVLVGGTWGSVCIPTTPTVVLPSATTVSVACRAAGLSSYYTYGVAPAGGSPAVMKSPSCSSSSFTSLLSCSHVAPDSACTNATNLMIECYATTPPIFSITPQTFSPGSVVEDVAVAKTNNDGRRDLILLVGAAGSRAVMATPGVCR